MSLVFGKNKGKEAEKVLEAHVTGDTKIQSCVNLSEPICLSVQWD
jgi:hypothetical protein